MTTPRLRAACPAPDEIHAAIDGQQFPPVLTPDQAADLLQVSKHTVYRYVSDGRLRRCVRRGRPLRFWRDRLIAEFFAA